MRGPVARLVLVGVVLLATVGAWFSLQGHDTAPEPPRVPVLGAPPARAVTERPAPVAIPPRPERLDRLEDHLAEALEAPSPHDTASPGTIVHGAGQEGEAERRPFEEVTVESGNLELARELTSLADQLEDCQDPSPAGALDASFLKASRQMIHMLELGAPVQAASEGMADRIQARLERGCGGSPAIDPVRQLERPLEPLDQTEGG